MNAEHVWQVWRRILCEDVLQAALFEPDFSSRALELGLSERDMAVALAYASTPTETRWAIETYRFRSFNVIVEALYVAAPLSARLLQRRGFDLDVLAQEYLATIGWKDNGPYTYRTCAATLAYLDERLGGVRDPELNDLIGFELATIGLMRRLAVRPLMAARNADTAIDARTRFVHSGRGVVVRTRFDLTPWLRDPELIGATSLEPAPLTFLRYLSSSHDEPALVALRGRALSVYELLATPRSIGELSQSLNDDSESTAHLVLRFLGFGVVERIGG